MKLSVLHRRLQEYILKNDQENKKWFNFCRDKRFFGKVVEIGVALLKELGDATNEDEVRAAISRAFAKSTKLHVDALFHNDPRVCISTIPIETTIGADYFDKSVSEEDFRALIEKGYGIYFQKFLHTCLSDIKNLEFDAIGSKASKDCKEAVGLQKISSSLVGGG